MKPQLEVYLRRANKVLVRPGIGQTSKQHLAALIKNFESLGYGVSEALYEQLATLGDKGIMFWYKEVFPVLKQLRGADTTYPVMYPNFPTQVMVASEAELYINAILHYMGDLIGERITPDYNKEERFPLIDNFDLVLLDLGSGADAMELIKNLISSKTSLSQQDKEDIALYVRETTSLHLLLPDEIPHKETLAFVTSAVMERKKVNETSLLFAYYKTATDVLRLATALSDGDISLAENTKYKRFSRPQRRLLLALLEEANASLDDMKRHRNKWLRLNQILHPQERAHALQFPTVAKLFRELCDAKGGNSFNASVEAALEKGNYMKAAKLLATRPGELARRLDHLLRSVTTTEARQIAGLFALEADKIATPLLLQLRAHFTARENGSLELRAVMPKGSLAKIQAIEPQPFNIAPEVTQLVTRTCDIVLEDRFSELSSLGNVYIDPVMDKFLVPSSERSATSTSTRRLIRGSRIPFASKTSGVIRFFLHWHDEYNGSRVDVDMSTTFFDSNWNVLDHCSYTKLRSSIGNVVHSGDITSAPDGAAEFIDVELASLANTSVRYIVMHALVFRGPTFKEIPECFGGWMEREDLNSGEIFEAKTVQSIFDLTGETKNIIPMIVDLQEREVIWADVARKNNVHFSSPNNVENNLTGATLMAKAVANMNKPTLGHLFRLHANARGTVVSNREDADTVFALDEGVTPFNYETIVGEYL